jgi:aspartate beta-hydroxylase
MLRKRFLLKMEELQNALPKIFRARRRAGQVLNSNPRLAIWLRGLDARQRLNMDEARSHYFKLICALQEMGETARARDCMNLAIRHGVWREHLHMPEHFMHAVPDKHIHDANEFAFVEFLEKSYPVIRAELDTVTEPAHRGFKPVKEQNLVQRGAWDEIVFHQGGQRFEKACRMFPQTSKILEQIPDVVNGPGVATLSWLHPGTRVLPHCGPTNSVLRVHLGLKVPPGCGMRIKDERVTWEEGRCLVFDHAYEHEVWNMGSSSRVVLLFDIFHPSLSRQDRKALPRELLTLRGVTEKFMKDRGVLMIERRADGQIAMRPDDSTESVLLRYLEDLGLSRVARGSNGLQTTPEGELHAAESGTP